MKRFFCLLSALLFSAYSMAQGNVVLIGDSIFANNGEIKNHLELITELTIDSYAVGGARMSDIVEQYYSIDLSNSNGIAIMNGGGNDILQDNFFNCKAFNEKCKDVIDDRLEVGLQLVEEMADDGMKYVIYLGYYYTTGFASGFDQAVDYATEQIQGACELSSFEGCYIVDSRNAFNSGTGFITWDGIHPTLKGSRVLAELIWETMVENNIQP